MEYLRFPKFSKKSIGFPKISMNFYEMYWKPKEYLRFPKFSKKSFGFPKISMCFYEMYWKPNEYLRFPKFSKKNQLVFQRFQWISMKCIGNQKNIDVFQSFPKKTIVFQRFQWILMIPKLPRPWLASGRNMLNRLDGLVRDWVTDWVWHAGWLGKWLGLIVWMAG